ncbi:MAG: ABC transporter ATP-binding protein, partial [Actinobacteria bacterium]|nr:ABC transporter ATP-binding protein [Actinomycetota bacterium]
SCRGGMRQRVMIAMALVLSPRLVVFDEPTTALDVVVQHDILARVAQLREELGFALVFITHDLGVLLELADRVAVMYAGRVVELAPVEEIYLSPLHPYTEALLHSFPVARGARETLTGIPGSPPDMRSLPCGCAFHPRCAIGDQDCQSSRPELTAIGNSVVACLKRGSASTPSDARQAGSGGQR